MKVLITCFSAISNVACIVPQLSGLAEEYPENTFIVLSRDFLWPLFAPIKGVRFVGADIRGKDAGVMGMRRIYGRLKEFNPDVVLDMQCSWRTRIISRLFSMHHVKTYEISHDRKERRRLIQRGAQKYRPLKTIFQRQSELYAKIGLATNDDFVSLPAADEAVAGKITAIYGEKKGFWIGVAPFSIAAGKTLPFRKIKNVISHFDQQENVKIFLFGYGELEYELLNDWQTIYHNAYAVHTHLCLDEELALMEKLDVMLCMDSANMHLASLKAVPVVSVWGASHPYAGFMGWKQDGENAVGVEFSCRPCTIHSDRKCKFADYRCLESIESVKIINTIEKFNPNNK